MQYAFLNRNKSSQLQVRDKSLKDQISGVQNKTVTNFHTPSDLSNSVFQKNTICIPHSEIERIKDSCLINSDPEQERKLRERQELYNKSQERVKNWPNTLHAIRKKKDETRFERFKKEEEERRLIDQQEVLYQANAKRQVIDKANKQIYEGGDRIKAFQSRLLLVDAIQEREGQMELKQQMREIEKAREEVFAEAVKVTIRQQEEEEQKRKEILELKKKQTQKILKDQHDEMKAKFIKRVQDEKIEGEIIKQKALEALSREKEDERLRREKTIQTQLDAKKGNDMLLQIKQEIKLKELKDEEKIKEYAKKKEDMNEMKKVRQEMRIQEKQEQRQRLIDAQTKRLLELKSQEEGRINKQIIEAQVKADEAEAKKREAIAIQKKRFDESIILTLKRKEENSIAQKLQDQAYQDFWKIKSVQIQEKEKIVKQEAFNRAKNLQDFQTQQAIDKQKIRDSQFISELDEADKIKQRMESDDQNFNVWASRMIQEQHQEGKDVRPLLKELASYHKRV